MDALSLAVDAAVALSAWNAEMPADQPHPQSGNWGGVMATWMAEGVVEVSGRPSGDAGLYLTGRDVAGRALAPLVLSSPSEPCPDDPDGQHHICCGCEDSDFLEDPAAESGSADAGPPSVSQGRSGRPGHECTPNICCGCQEAVGDEWSLTGPGEDHGFCSKACMALYVKGRFFLSPSQLSGVA